MNSGFENCVVKILYCESLKMSIFIILSQYHSIGESTEFISLHIRCQNEQAHKDFKKAVGAIRIVYSSEKSELVVMVSSWLSEHFC